MTGGEFVMPNTSVVIDRSLLDVWSFLADKCNWKAWHGATLVSVEPGWQSGATLVWEDGSSSNLEACVARKLIRLGTRFMSRGYELIPIGDSTELRYFFEARGGASFSDKGAAHLASYEKNLRRLKQLLEDARRE
jgi:hypothetical protein